MPNKICATESPPDRSAPFLRLRLSQPGTTAFIDLQNDPALVRFIWLTALIFITMGVFDLGHHLRADQPLLGRVTMSSLVVVVGLAAVALMSRKLHLHAFRLMVWGGWLITSAVIVVSGGVYSPNLALYPLIIFSAGWILSVRTGMNIAALTVVATMGLAGAAVVGMLPAAQMAPMAVSVTTAVAVLVASALCTYYFSQGYQRHFNAVRDLGLDLGKSEARLNYVLSVAKESVWDWNPVNDRIRYDRDWCRMLGLNERNPEHPVAAFEALLHEDDREAVIARRKNCLAGNGAYRSEHRLRLPDGRVIWVEDHGDIFARDEAGQPLHMIGSIADITERKETEKDLRIAATAFESQEGMFITDAASVILRVNRAFSEITGYSAEEAVGQTPKLLGSGRHDAAFFAAMMESIERSGTWQGEIWNRRKSGEVFPEWLTITAVKDQQGALTHYVSTLTDITSRKTAENEIRHLAFYDPLTRLPNRRLLLDRLRQAVASSSRSELHGALLFIDLDNFKTLNDTRGHEMGDMLLQQVALRLTACVRACDTVARLGGDEFVVMLEDLNEDPQESAARARIVGEKILAALNQTYQLAANAYRSTPSIGITLFANHQGNIDDLLKRADLAMYQAKAAGRNTLRFFDPAMQAIVMARATLEADLREALESNQFLLYYQAQTDGAGLPTGVEALVRWRHPQRGLVSPAEFIPLAEETGLILQLGHWVLKTACHQLALWAAQPEMEQLTIAVNVSARQFHQRDFVDQVLAVIEHSGANPRRLKLELTESLLVDDVEDVIAKMAALKATGVGFSLDDFGTGFSSLSCLKRLPLDQLKIDQGFIRNVLSDPNDAAIAKMVVALGESMSLAVIAEGVETEAQRDFLAHHGCHAYQGYLFSRPLPIEEFEQFRRQFDAGREEDKLAACGDDVEKWPVIRDPPQGVGDMLQ
ncbi:MAG: EAL domain-containing protein [Sulfuritalea sp.]|nr:EAL domain-containing protein [Sulfuritalea sp.]